jgi:hypothetical protein
MRTSLTTGLLLIFCLNLFAQNNPAMQENSGENLKEFTSSVFKYPDFVEGKIILKDGSAYDAKLNYSRVLGKFLVIDKTGKTRPFADPDTLDKIIITKDTFYYSNNSFLQKVTHFSIANLYLKQMMVYVNDPKSPSNGTPGTSSGSSTLVYDYSDSKNNDIAIEKNSLFKTINEYFIGDQSMNLFGVTKKNLYDLFPKSKNELKTYLKHHSVNFGNIEQVAEVLQYMNSLKN